MSKPRRTIHFGASVCKWVDRPSTLALDAVDCEAPFITCTSTVRTRSARARRIPSPARPTADVGAPPSSWAAEKERTGAIHSPSVMLRQCGGVARGAPVCLLQQQVASSDGDAFDGHARMREAWTCRSAHPRGLPDDASGCLACQARRACRYRSITRSWRSKMQGSQPLPQQASRSGCSGA